MTCFWGDVVVFTGSAKFTGDGLDALEERLEGTWTLYNQNSELICNLSLSMPLSAP